MPSVNDNFAGIEVITGLTGSISGDNTGATAETGEPGHEPGNSGAPGGTSVWYSWTAPATGIWKFTVTTTSGFDYGGAVIDVFTGASLASLTKIAEVDQTNYPGRPVYFVAEAGVAYSIRVDGWDATQVGTFTLDWATYTNPAPAYTPPAGTVRFFDGYATTSGGQYVGRFAVTFPSLPLTLPGDGMVLGFDAFVGWPGASGVVADIGVYNEYGGASALVDGFTFDSSTAPEWVSAHTVWRTDVSSPPAWYHGGDVVMWDGDWADFDSGTSLYTVDPLSDPNWDQLIAAPTISSFSPVAAMEDVDTVTVDGSGYYETFPGSVHVEVGPSSGYLRNVALVSSAELTFVPVDPGHPAIGDYALRVEAAGGDTTSTGTLRVYPFGDPVITAITPPSSVMPGGTVTISGAGFTGVTAVYFTDDTGGTVPAASFAFVDGATITAVVPVGVGGGPVHVTRVTDGVSYTGSGGTFTPVGAPTVSSFVPTTGYAGNTVTITGAGFTGATDVAIGAYSVARFTVDSDTQITAVLQTPMGPGSATFIPKAHVRVRGAGGWAHSPTDFTPLPTAVTRASRYVTARGTSIVLSGTRVGNIPQVDVRSSPPWIGTVTAVDGVTFDPARDSLTVPIPTWASLNPAAMSLEVLADDWVESHRVQLGVVDAAITRIAAVVPTSSQVPVLFAHAPSGRERTEWLAAAAASPTEVVLGAIMLDRSVHAGVVTINGGGTPVNGPTVQLGPPADPSGLGYLNPISVCIAAIPGTGLFVVGIVRLGNSDGVYFQDEWHLVSWDGATLALVDSLPPAYRVTNGHNQWVQAVGLAGSRLAMIGGQDTFFDFLPTPDTVQVWSVSASGFGSALATTAVSYAGDVVAETFWAGALDGNRFAAEVALDSGKRGVVAFAVDPTTGAISYGNFSDYPDEPAHPPVGVGLAVASPTSLRGVSRQGVVDHLAPFYAEQLTVTGTTVDWTSHTVLASQDDAESTSPSFFVREVAVVQQMRDGTPGPWLVEGDIRQFLSATAALQPAAVTAVSDASVRQAQYVTALGEDPQPTNIANFVPSGAVIVALDTRRLFVIVPNFAFAGPSPADYSDDGYDFPLRGVVADITWVSTGAAAQPPSAPPTSAVRGTRLHRVSGGVQ